MKVSPTIKKDGRLWDLHKLAEQSDPMMLHGHVSLVGFANPEIPSILVCEACEKNRSIRVAEVPM